MPPVESEASKQQESSLEEQVAESSFQRFFKFLKPLSHRERLKTLERRLGYTLKELDSYGNYKTRPPLPAGMEESDLPSKLADCLNYFRGVENCVTASIKRNKDEEAFGFPYSRISGCKPHYVRFMRCVKFRDQTVVNSICKWEREHLETLDKNERKSYLEKLQEKYRYLELPVLLQFLDYLNTQDDDNHRPSVFDCQSTHTIELLHILLQLMILTAPDVPEMNRYQTEKGFVLQRINKLKVDFFPPTESQVPPAENITPSAPSATFQV